VIDGRLAESDCAPCAGDLHFTGLRIGHHHARVVPWRGGPCQRSDATPSRGLSGWPHSRSSPGSRTSQRHDGCRGSSDAVNPLLTAQPEPSRPN
jgi:hypothetical protein